MPSQTEYGLGLNQMHAPGNGPAPASPHHLHLRAAAVRNPEFGSRRLTMEFYMICFAAWTS